MSSTSDDPVRPWPIAPWVLFSATLGMAPFVPEPHLVGKLRWVAGGAVGMTLLDWGDLLMHGAPVVVLLLVLARNTWVARR